MKRIFVVTLLLCTLSVTCAGLAQAQAGVQTPQPNPASEIKVSKDSVETSVSTTLRRIRVSLNGREVPVINLYLAVAASFPPSGISAKPDYIQLHLWNKSEPNLTFGVRADRLLWFNVDGEQVLLGHMNRQDLRDLGGIDGFVEKLEVTVLYDDFVKITNGKQVNGRLGSLAFALTEDERAVFQEFIKAVTPKSD